MRLSEIILETPFPWDRRTSEEWLQIPKRKVLRLFYAAAHAASYEQTDKTDSPEALLCPPTLIDRLRLTSAFQIHYGSIFPVLREDLDEMWKKDHTHLYNPEELNNWQGTLEGLFSDIRFYRFLEISDSVRQLQKKEELPHGFETFNLKRAELLGLNPLTVANLHLRYENLVSVFYPLAEKEAKFRSRKSSLEEEEWLSIASENLLRLNYSFPWETFAINPTWTTKIFALTLKKSIQDPQAQRYNMGLTVHPNDEYFQFKDTSIPVEEQTEQSEQSGALVGMINKMRDPTEREILLWGLKMGIENAKEVAERLNLPVGKVKSAQTHLRLIVQERTGRVKEKYTTFWQRYSEDPQKYKDMVLKFGNKIPPFHRELAEALIEGDYKDWPSALKAVWAKFPNLKWGTITSQVPKAFGMLEGRVRLRVNTLWLSHWDRHKEGVIVQQLSQDRNFWDPVPDKWKEIFLYIYEDPRNPRDQREAAKKFGIHESVVSRKLSQLRRNAKKYLYEKKKAQQIS